MRSISRAVLSNTVGLLAVVCAAGQQPAWKAAYSGVEATGDHVLALYQFRPAEPGKDNSGHGHELTIRGASRFVSDGPVPQTGSLESFATDQTAEKPAGATAPHDPKLTPAGAFTVELWVKPKPELASASGCMLVDKKYINYTRPGPEANSDYCLFLSRAAGGKHALVADLGFGQDSSQFVSEPILLTPGEWHFLAFSYNGQGVGRFFVNGEPAGRVNHPNRGAVAGGRHPLVIGDRVGSSYMGFPGFVGQVRIANGLPAWVVGRLVLTADEGRRVFERFEPGAALTLSLLNDTSRPLQNLAVSVSGGICRAVAPATRDLPADGSAKVTVTVDSALRPGDYPVKVTARAVAEGRPVEALLELPVTIAPRLPARLPVVLWGGDNDVSKVGAIGFTHQIMTHAWYEKIWELGAEGPADSPHGVATKRRLLDEHLRLGMRGTAYIYEPHWLENNAELIKKYGRVNRAGELVTPHAVCGLLPEVKALSRNTGRAVARAFGDHPAFDSCLIHSEQRDGTEVCFHPEDRAAYKAATGRDIPELVAGKSGVRYEGIKGFPLDRVVADDDPLLTYYRWFWKEGDGWNGLHTEAHEGLQPGVKPSFWTFYDPAIRVPPLWGSGGEVDVLSSWTYSYPDPIKMGQATDELFAMAGGTGQQVMKMTQVIWYRSGTAPKLPEDESARASWEKEQPDAQFITISPDHLREALWCKLARPIKGIMYHGWGSLVPGETGAYRCTDLRARDTLKQLVDTVVEPLGPTLLEVPDAPADVALLESFTSTIFAGRGSWGWSQSWEADTHLVLQYAQLQPRILYDEHVVRDGLKGYKVLVMPYCDVLTRTVVERVKAFQRGGGIVVALLKLAADLRAELDQVYTRRLAAADPEVVTRLRRYANAEYVFAINDHRTYGKYVGHHGKVMEDGLPASTRLTLRRSAGTVYDLGRRTAAKVVKTAGGLSWDVALGPGDGRLFAVVEKPVASVAVTAPKTARLGAPLVLQVAVRSADGKPLAAVVPVELTITDPAGRVAEYSGHYGARDGQVKVTITPARNDQTGRWLVRAVEGFSARRGEATVTMQAAK
ncbi:MAG: hypothetical protein HUU35_07115 [Armatimonadetes bacterium]|nr:hypothetical protein [Armatimonadota bacterium]